MKTVKVQIDAKHTLELLAGRAVTIKVPKGAEALQLNLNLNLPVRPAEERNYLAEVVDVFFNGRKAR